MRFMMTSQRRQEDNSKMLCCPIWVVGEAARCR
jgi:hypothetical protein